MDLSNAYAVDSFADILATKPPPQQKLTPTEQGQFHLTNSITVYGKTKDVTKQLIDTVMNYDIWTDRGKTVNIPMDRWMRVKLKPEWESIIKPGTSKVYPLSMCDQVDVDKCFDKLHSQDRMDWTKMQTPFSSSVFVVWRYIHKDKQQIPKGRIVIDMRMLNAATIRDAYPMPQQEI
jgi:hypothetical protein